MIGFNKYMEFSDLYKPVNKFYEDVNHMASAQPEHLISDGMANTFNRFLIKAKDMQPNNEVLQGIELVIGQKRRLGDLVLLAWQLKLVVQSPQTRVG